MIISPHHRYIFIHIVKAGGTSMETALEPHLRWDDLHLGTSAIGQSLNAPYAQRFGLSDHSPYGDVVRVCGADFVNGCFSFAIVRDPMARAASLYNFLHMLAQMRGRARKIDMGAVRKHILSGGDATDPPFVRWVSMQHFAAADDFSAFLAGMTPDADIGFRPQIDMIAPPPGVKPVDMVIRLEDVMSDLPMLSRRLGFALALPHLNRSEGPANAATATLSDRKRVLALYEDDYLAFDYPRR
jgi:Sulfotransferase family